MYVGLHHMQLAMPQGQESAARDFYAGVLGLAEIAKPPGLAGRGGVWFRSGVWSCISGSRSRSGRPSRVIREFWWRTWTR